MQNSWALSVDFQFDKIFGCVYPAFIVSFHIIHIYASSNSSSSTRLHSVDLYRVYSISLAIAVVTIQHDILYFTSETGIPSKCPPIRQIVSQFSLTPSLIIWFT